MYKQGNWSIVRFPCEFIMDVLDLLQKCLKKLSKPVISRYSKGITITFKKKSQLGHFGVI